MKQPYSDETEYELFEEKARELGGYDDPSLQREASNAERKLQAANPDVPEDGGLSDEEIGARFGLLMDRIQSGGIRPVSEKKYERQRRKDNRPLRRGGRLCGKMAAAAVLAAALALGGGIAAKAGNGDRCGRYLQPEKRNEANPDNAAGEGFAGDGVYPQEKR